MCDLWKNTLAGPTPPGAIPEQIRFALSQIDLPDPSRSAIKLYNAGSFFDSKAVPPSDLPAIAALVSPFGRVIIECHPSLVGPRVLAFRDMIPGQLEVAMGLETAHPEILARLNKGMTLELFRRSSRFLRDAGIDVRTFILVKPPWMTEAEGVEWARRSLDFAFACGSTTCCLIPTRPGNGALDALLHSGEFSPPTLRSLELSLEYGLSLRLGPVLADTWDLSLLAACPTCRDQRLQRLRHMNYHQNLPRGLNCPACPR
jgi:radical SAM enzyme (TIGR01210 family)